MTGFRHRSFLRYDRVVLATALMAAVVWISPAARASAAADGALLMTVFDSAGAPIRDLTTKEFLVREDGIDRVVTGAKLSADPMSVAVLIDTSQPRQGAPSTASEMRAGVGAFISTMLAANAATQIGLMEFAGAAVMTVKYTSDAEALDKAARRLFPSQRSNAVLLEALVDVSKSIRKLPGRRAIVSLDFSSQESSETPVQTVANEIRQSGATFWAVSIQAAGGAAGNTDQRDTNNARDLILSRIPEASGGMRLTAVSNTTVETLMKRVAACLTSQYVVTYTRPDGPPAKVVQATATRGEKVVFAPLTK